jgi:uncharacterized membrane protein YqjE
LAQNMKTLLFIAFSFLGLTVLVAALIKKG